MKYVFMKCNINIFNAQLLKVNTLVDGIYSAKGTEDCHIRDGQNVYIGHTCLDFPRTLTN